MSESTVSTLSAYYIPAWSRVYEVRQSTQYQNISWLPFPNNFSSTGIIESLQLDDGLKFLGTWLLIAQLASTMPIRGLFVKDSGKALSIKGMAMILRISEDDLKQALDHFDEIGWITYGLADDFIEKNPIKNEKNYQLAVSVLSANCQLEKKRKEKKRKEYIADEKSSTKKTIPDLASRKKDFAQKISQFQNQFDSETLRNFYDYWTEANSAGKKMRFEMEKTWDLEKRLKRWKNSTFGKSEQQRTTNDIESALSKL